MFALGVIATGLPSTAETDVAFIEGSMPDPGSPAWEPGMAVDGGGTFWVASILGGRPPAPPDPTDTTLPGAAVWKSTDNGATYEFVGNPVPFAGFDADIAAAPVKNALGSYNVYAAGLYPGGNALAVSPDGGANWITNPAGGLPGQADRPWLAADGACGLYLAYRNGPPWWVNRYDLCGVSSGVSPVPLDVVEVTPTGVTGVNTFAGKLTVDNSGASHYKGRAYFPLEVCDFPIGPSGEGEEESSGCLSDPRIVVAWRNNSASNPTWVQTTVASVRNGAMPIWPVTVATDAKGVVYVTWFNDLDALLSKSTDGGLTWSTPVQVNKAPSVTAVYPTVAAFGNGVVEVAWYGTDRDGDPNDPGLMGSPNSTGAAEWRVYWARSIDGGLTFKQQAVSPVVHTGELCTHGTGCTRPNTRNLYDDFGVAISPLTGAASIAFTTDQPGGLGSNDHIGYASEVCRQESRSKLSLKNATKKGICLSSS